MEGERNPTHMTDIKFALRSFSGMPTKFFEVSSETFTEAPVAKKTPSHHILVVDRSGSMYGDLPDLKVMVEKLLTLGEFDDDSLRVSLVSYSSQGDVKLHFKHITVGDVMKASSPHLQEIRALRATSMTCISQGLVMAETLIDDNEITCITLHTDGFANDSSPTAESRTIATVVESLKKHPNVFVNTIAYRDWCDFNLLSSISNALSGVCIQAKNIKQVYEALHSATALLAGSMSPVLEAPIKGFNYVIFFSKSAKKVLGSQDNLVIRGLGASDDKTVYRYREISEKAYDALDAEESYTSPAILAYGRAQISEGRLNAAKYAAVATLDSSLLSAHSRALVSSDVAKFAEGLEERLFGDTKYFPMREYGLPATGPSVLRVLSALNKYAGSLNVNLNVMLSGYKRRGVKSVQGTRAEDGTLVLPTVKSKVEAADPEGWVSVNKFEINRNNATVNMLVSQSIGLYKDETRIASVSGIDLSNLRSFNNYTLVGDGTLNVNQLIFRTTDKRCFRELLDLKVVTGTYQPKEAFVIDFSELPLVDYDTNFDSVSPNEVQDLAKLVVLSKIFSGIFKGESTSLTGEQIAELGKFYLTPALNFSPPSTNEYANRDEAIASGKIDTRLSYKINLGYPALTSVTKLKSGNAYLQRRFEATFHGSPVKDPTLDLLAMDTKWSIKKLTGRTKLDEVDALSYPLYEGLLGLGSRTEFDRVLKLASVNPESFFKAFHGTDREETLAVTQDALRAIEEVVESFYDRVRPLAFYVGATGLVPDSLDATAYTADQFEAKYPEAKLNSDEKSEGTFFVLPNGLVITVYVKAEFFSTGV